MIKTKFVAIISTVMLLCGRMALANGVAIYEIPGNTAIPIQHHEVQMLKEYVKIINNGDLVVTADFIFVNTSSKKISMQMGFPFTTDTEPPRGIAFRGDGSSDNSFEVKINGVVTKVERKKMAENVKLRIGAQYDYGYVWAIEFAPHEKKKVVCTYNIEWDAPDPQVLSRSFRYITKTGALWKNSIEEATFHVKLDKHISKEIENKEIALEIIPKGYKLIDNRIIEWTFRNWKPKEDIEVRIWDIRK